MDFIFSPSWLIERQSELVCAGFWSLFVLGHAFVLLVCFWLWKCNADIKLLASVVQRKVGFSFFPMLNHPRQFEWEGCWFDPSSALYTTRFRLRDSSHFLIMTKQPIHYLNWSSFIRMQPQHQQTHQAKPAHLRPVRSLLIKQRNLDTSFRHVNEIRPSKLLPMLWDSHAHWDLHYLASYLSGISVSQIENVYIMHSLRKEDTFVSLDKLNITQVL